MRIPAAPRRAPGRQGLEVRDQIFAPAARTFAGTESLPSGRKTVSISGASRSTTSSVRVDRD
jgi:hypothetical protein